MLQAGPVERILDGQPGGWIWAVTGRLVADFAHDPTALVMEEGDFSGAQDRCTTSAGDVLASSWREPQGAATVDDEGERLRKLIFAARRQSGGEVIRRPDQLPFTAEPHRGKHIRRTYVSVVPQPFCHPAKLSDAYALPAYS